MITPLYLSQGDKIAIIAPAGKIEKNVVNGARRTLEQWGLEVVPGNHLFDNDFSFAATDDKRMKDFQDMLDDPSVKAVLCARGGYGSVRIIDNLDFSTFIKNPKWIIGFSDITVFHSHLQEVFGIESLHANMAKGLHKKNSASDSLYKVLFGEELLYTIPLHSLSRKGKCFGELTGGNLAVVCSLIGTPSEVNTQGKILFIEEIGEHLYRIDRMIQQLKRAAKLKGLAGLIVGDMTDIPDNKEDFGKTAYEIIREAVEEYNYPVCFGFPAGHQEDNRALIFGRKTELLVDDFTTLNFQPET